MATEITTYAYGFHENTIKYDPLKLLPVPGWDDMSQTVIVGPRMEVRTFIATILRIHYGDSSEANVNTLAMVLNDRIAFPASQRTLGQVLYSHLKLGRVRLNITNRVVNATFDFVGTKRVPLTLDITQTFGELKKQLKIHNDLDLTGKRIKRAGEELIDDFPLGFVAPNSTNDFQCTKR